MSVSREKLPGDGGSGRRKTIIAFFAGFMSAAVAAVLITAFVPGNNAFGAYSASGANITSPKGDLISIFLPTKKLTRWSQDNNSLKRRLEDMGYKVDLYYSDNDADTQAHQIERAISVESKVIIVSTIDGATLSPVLEKASAAGIKIIAYDRPIVNTENVDCCVGFDSYKAGMFQGTYIEEKLGLKTATGPFNIELFAGSYDTEGSYDDNSAVLCYQGAMSVLQPYIDSGKLVVKSGEVTLGAITVKPLISETAQTRMARLLKSYYHDIKLDALLCSNDSIAMGIIAALEGAGYNAETKPFPVLTGQDCDIANMNAIIKGMQSMSIFKDKRVIEKRRPTWQMRSSPEKK